MAARWLAVWVMASATVAEASPRASSAYPIEQVLRPITLLEGMAELSIVPHGELAVRLGAATGWESGTTLRARAGITSRVQLGLTYVLEGAYHDPLTASHELGLHPGKAVGLDVTVVIEDWIAIEVGVPVYLDPVALSLQIGMPLKLALGDRFAIGGLDDLLTVKLERFPPSLHLEGDNALAAANDRANTAQSNGDLRVSVYAIYQEARTLALLGRLGLDEQDFSTRHGTNGYGGVMTLLRAGFVWTPCRWLDLGFSIGFDDVAHAGTFGPAGYLAVRI